MDQQTLHSLSEKDKSTIHNMKHRNVFNIFVSKSDTLMIGNYHEDDDYFYGTELTKDDCVNLSELFHSLSECL